MIGKTYPLGKGFLGLTRYLESGTSREERDRVAWVESRNLPTTNPEVAARLMAATARESERTQRPVYHLSISFDPGDVVNREAMRGVADAVLHKLGLTEHEALIVAHKDAAHPHMHLVVNRVHPEHHKAWNNSWDWPRIEEVLRREEVVRGLRVVPGKHARVRGVDPAPTLARGDAVFLGEVQKRAAPVLERARTWAEVEAGLAVHGLAVRIKGGGLAIHDGRQEVKASEAGRAFSRSKMEQRLGKLSAHRLAVHAEPQPVPAPPVRAPELERPPIRAPEPPRPVRVPEPDRPPILTPEPWRSTRAPEPERPPIRAPEPPRPARAPEPDGPRVQASRPVRAPEPGPIAAPEPQGAARRDPKEPTRPARGPRVQPPAPLPRPDDLHLQEQWRLLIREAAERIRAERVVRAKRAAFEAIGHAAGHAEASLAHVEARQRDADNSAAKFREKLDRVFADPAEATARLQEFQRTHGWQEMHRALGKTPERFGPLRKGSPLWGLGLVQTEGRARVELAALGLSKKRLDLQVLPLQSEIDATREHARTARKALDEILAEWQGLPRWGTDEREAAELLRRVLRDVPPEVAARELTRLLPHDDYQAAQIGEAVLRQAAGPAHRPGNERPID